MLTIRGFSQKHFSKSKCHSLKARHYKNSSLNLYAFQTYIDTALVCCQIMFFWLQNWFINILPIFVYAWSNHIESQTDTQWYQKVSLSLWGLLRRDCSISKKKLIELLNWRFFCHFIAVHATNISLNASVSRWAFLTVQKLRTMTDFDFQKYVTAFSASTGRQFSQECGWSKVGTLCQGTQACLAVFLSADVYCFENRIYISR